MSELALALPAFDRTVIVAIERVSPTLDRETVIRLGLATSERLEIVAIDRAQTESGWPIELSWAKLPRGDATTGARLLARFDIAGVAVALLLAGELTDQFKAQAANLVAAARPGSAGVSCAADFYRGFAAWPNARVEGASPNQSFELAIWAS